MVIFLLIWIFLNSAFLFILIVIILFGFEFFFMEKFNRYWMLKYSEHRSQLKSCCLGSKDEFLDSLIFEVTYPHDYKGPQVRYILSNVHFPSFPDGTMFLILSRKEKSRLYSYYQLDKFLCY